MSTISRFDLTSRLCRITCYGDLAFLFLSGDTPRDAAPDHQRQAGEVFARLDAMLAEAGSHRSMIMSATIWVDGVAACDLVERLFAEWIGPHDLPALTIGASRLVSPGKLIEVGLACRRHTSDREATLPAIERLVKTPRVSRIVKYGELIFLAGVTSPEPDPDPRRQVAQVLARIDDFLAQAGSDKHHILSATVWLADVRHADAMNAAWDDWVSRESPPARATVEARLVTPQLLVEIGIIAAPSLS
jgi:enamine deaminase RidA (YjgF/YER057c/UK114 family)